ncbi:MAG: biopolymer transporter ExbD, partial [Planctomycetes bacterium]|nr:biopolymer transporter ExbD [Planctomycetota bacterium]
MPAPKFRKQDRQSFNMTPIIDVVFLLIIFFMLVCQFIVAENYDVTVPDKITSAHDEKNDSEKLTTVTVMRQDDGQIAYAVGSERFVSNTKALAEKIAKRIDAQLSRLSGNEKIVNLRIDKEIDYRHSQYALAG